MEVNKYIISKLVYFTYLRDIQPTYMAVIIQLLGTMWHPNYPASFGRLLFLHDTRF